MKTRKCKYCRSEFIPYTSLQKNCFHDLCVKAMIKEHEVKQWNKKKAKLKKDLMTASDWLKIAQTTFNKFIRLRDTGLNCISCGKPLKIGNVDAGHLWSAGGHSNIRFNEYNVNAQCSRPCNKDKSGDINNYRIQFVKRYNVEILNELDSIAHIEKKWTINELKEIVEIYKKKIVNLR